jgi:hypothetical protein
MNLLLIQRKGVDLYQTLLSSETSRDILKFYPPVRMPCGVKMTSATLGSTLSLVSELRWYIRRYVAVVLFETSQNKYCSLDLAQEIYERETTVTEPWGYRCIMGIKDGTLAYTQWAEPKISSDDGHTSHTSADFTLEVWCSEREYLER